MRKLVARYIGFPLQDFIKRTEISKSYKELLLTEKYSKDALLYFQINKLKNLINYSYYNVKYYKELLDSVGVKPSDIRTLDDIKKIPITLKNVARNAESLMFSKKINTMKTKDGKTGGTTGVPFFYRKNIDTRSIGWGAYYRWYKWMKIRPEDKKVIIWGASEIINFSLKEKIKLKFIDFLQNSITINSFDINPKTLPKIVRKIARFKPKLIRGYLSAILQLAYYLEENNITTIRPMAVSPTTETLLPPYRSLLEKVFQSPIYDQYGCGECGSIAFECEKHEGMHITLEHCIIEIVDGEGNDAGFELGDVIVTDLDNYAMPFIRYNIGDKARLKKEKCSCGRAHSLIAEIYGRSAETIILKNGSRVHGVFFTDILGELNFIESKVFKRFQAYQNKAGILEFRIESDVKLEKENEIRMLRILEKYFEKVSLKYYHHLNEDKSGKFRYVLSEID